MKQPQARHGVHHSQLVLSAAHVAQHRSASRPSRSGSRPWRSVTRPSLLSGRWVVAVGWHGCVNAPGSRPCWTRRRSFTCLIPAPLAHKHETVLSPRPGGIPPGGAGGGAGSDRGGGGGSGGLAGQVPEGARSQAAAARAAAGGMGSWTAPRTLPMPRLASLVCLWCNGGCPRGGWLKEGAMFEIMRKETLMERAIALALTNATCRAPRSPGGPRQHPRHGARAPAAALGARRHRLPARGAADAAGHRVRPLARVRVRRGVWPGRRPAARVFRGAAARQVLRRRLQRLHLCLRPDWQRQDAHDAGAAGRAWHQHARSAGGRAARMVAGGNEQGCRRICWHVCFQNPTCGCAPAAPRPNCRSCSGSRRRSPTGTGPSLWRCWRYTTM